MSNPKSDGVNKVPQVNSRKSIKVNEVRKPRKPPLQAPYNFVPLYSEVFEAYKSPQDLPDPRKISDELITGEISYSVLSKSPIVFEKGTSSLTASMMRGLIRSNLQILSFSSVDSDIEDVIFKYRDYSDAYFNKVLGQHIVTKKRGTTVTSYSEYGNIHAGIMYKDNNVWYIKPSSRMTFGDRVDDNLLAMISIDALGNIIKAYWNECYHTMFNPPYEELTTLIRELEQLNKVRNPLAHGAENYLSTEDKVAVANYCKKINYVCNEKNSKKRKK